MNLNLPNKITLLRIFLVPVFMLILLEKIPYGEYWAAFVFTLAALTDGLDGYIARKKKLITNLGKFMDPLADKLLVTAALISLVEMGRIPSWMATIIVSREFAVTGLRIIAASQGVVIAASSLGKYKTVSQIIAILAALLSLPYAMVIVWVAVILTIISGVDYFYNGRDLILNNPENTG